MTDKTGDVDFLAGFLVGALVGAAAALLLAPHSGEETRGIIRERGIELREQAEVLTGEARRRAQHLQIQAKERVEELQTQVKQAIDEGKTAATKRKEELLARIDEGRQETFEPVAE